MCYSGGGELVVPGTGQYQPLQSDLQASGRRDTVRADASWQRSRLKTLKRRHAGALAL